MNDHVSEKSSQRDQKHGVKAENISQPLEEMKWCVVRVQMTRLIRSDENGASDKTHPVFQHIPVRTFVEKYGRAPSCCLEEGSCFFLSVEE